MRENTVNQQLRADAPLRYVVKKGDTLWDIAGYYLRDPWYWPQLWYANPDIANPHLIYPGDVLILTRDADGNFQLRRAGTKVLSPRIRESSLESIVTIPMDAIRPFITGPRLVSAEELADIYEVLDAIIAANGLSADEIATVKAQKREKRGGFTKRIKLLWVDDPD